MPAASVLESHLAGRCLRHRGTIQVHLIEPHSQLLVITLDELSMSRPVDRKRFSVVESIIHTTMDHNVQGCERVDTVQMMFPGAHGQ